MTLPLEQLSLSAVMQPLFELQETITQLKMLKQMFDFVALSMTRPEVLDHIRVIRDHLTHSIAFYESILDLALDDIHRILGLYNQHTWNVPPVHGPRWS